MTRILFRKDGEAVTMEPYIRRVQYYETDMMGVAHHANYIRWMEEARIDLMDRLGFPYKRMEAEGVLSPVTEISCRYRRPCTFGDEIAITVRVESFNGVVMTIAYDMRDASGQMVCSASSGHVFLDKNGRFVRLKREMPEFCAAIERTMAEQAAEDAAKR